jgi:hypothetical protein
MRCYYHPIEDAVAVCKTCGKGVCSSCLVTIANNSYCKQCVEAGIVGAPAVEVSKPTGPPSRQLFIVGATGSILNMVASIIAVIIWALYMSIFSMMSYYSYDIETLLRQIIGMTSIVVIIVIVLAVGLLLASIGYLGLRRNYGSGVGTAGFVLGIVVFVFIFLTIASAGATLVALGSYNQYNLWNFIIWLFIFAILCLITIILFGVTQIIWGVAHIVTRKYTGHSGLAMATGIMLILSGVFVMTMILSEIGLILFFISEILAAITFLISHVPQQSTQTE